MQLHRLQDFNNDDQRQEDSINLLDEDTEALKNLHETDDWETRTW